MDENPQRPRDEKLLRAETVNCLVAISKAFASTASHRSLTHWDRLKSALNVSLTGVGNIGQWQHAILVRLQITALPSYLCSAFEALDVAIGRAEFTFLDWLYLVRREPEWFILQLRLESEKRAAAHAERLIDT